LHWTMPDLNKEENSLVYEFNWDPGDRIQAPQGTQSEALISPLPPRMKAESKRSMAGVTFMECDKQPPGKKPKVSTVKNIIELVEELICEYPGTIVEEEPVG